VLYLIITKRLFGVRGGKEAYDARLRSESVLAEAQRLAAAQADSHPATATWPGPASAGAVTPPPPDTAATAAPDQR
jgi:hypothetical protein